MHTRARGLVCPEKRIDWPADDPIPLFATGWRSVGSGCAHSPAVKRKPERRPKGAGLAGGAGDAEKDTVFLC